MITGKYSHEEIKEYILNLPEENIKEIQATLWAEAMVWVSESYILNIKLTNKKDGK